MLTIIKERSKGITLIALVVTIIVLIILAGISLNLLFGQNGLIIRAQDSLKRQKIAQKEEEVKLAINSVVIDNKGDSSKLTISQVVEEIRKNYSDENKSKIIGEAIGEVEDKFPGEITFMPPTSEIDENIVIRIGADLNVIGDIDESEPDEFSSQLTVNPEESTYTQKGNIWHYTPDLTGFSKKDTYYVTYNNSGIPVLAGSLEKAEAPENWFDYEGKKWANIVTVHDGQIAYWVWIPRYKYKTKVDDESLSQGFVDAKFVDIDGNCYMIKNGNKEEIDASTYHLPESFTFDNVELKGYWVSKYSVQLDGYDDDIHIKETSNSATITVAEPSGTYTLFINGKKYSDNITLPYTINNINTRLNYELLLVQNSTGKITNIMTKETLEAEEIEIELTGFNPECTYFVTYNDGGYPVISDEPISLDANGNILNAPDNWYDYRNKKWANIVTINEGQIAYWVWVPRYQYRVFSNGFVDSVFISKSKIKSDKFFEIPESFMFDGVNLKGYWVSKYSIQAEQYVDQIILTKYDNKTRVTTAGASGTYSIYIDGRKLVGGVTLPYEINKGKNDNYKIMLVRESDGQILSLVAEGVLPEEVEIEMEGFNLEHTYFVTYDENGNSVISEDHVRIENGQIVNAPENWYDYRNKKWANILTNNNGIVAYWVWIPRYQYKVFSNGFVDSVFIKNSKIVADEGFKIPESFIFDGVNLKGYWVSKYSLQNP